MVTKSLDRPTFYIAIALYESISSDPDSQKLYQERFILIKAISLDEAREKALEFTKQQECSYKNEVGSTITWSLKRIVDVASVLYEDFEDGTELYARHFRNYEAYYSFEPLLSGEQF